MTTFLEDENRRQAEFKQTSGYFSAEARADGEYLPSFGTPGGPVRLPYLLPLGYAEENLFAGIREGTLAYFGRQDIAWHNELPGGRPTNHLRDSQICCVNFLAPFAENPAALTELLRPLFPDLRRVLPMEEGRLVAFEWIGEQNYLGEDLYGRPRRRRGEYCTSADAAVRFEVDGGETEIVLIDWKYTEVCNGQPKHMSPKGTNRVLTYAPLYESAGCPLNKALLERFDDLFYDPFDQHMRLQFLAGEMERAKELDAYRVRVLHVAPAANADGEHVPTAAMRKLGASATEVWQRLVRPPGRFLSMHTEHLFGSLPLRRLPELEGWWRYLTGRYSWLTRQARG